MAEAKSLTVTEVKEFLLRLGQSFTQPTDLYLIGGSALCLLGNTRSTGDIDYVGKDLPDPNSELQRIIGEVANQMQIEVEGVPFDEFIPLPTDVAQRHYFLGQFDNLSVYIFDPYSIALSKIDRGFESDLQDVVFLIREDFIMLTQLEQVVQNALPRAREFDLSPRAMREHLDAVRQMLKL